MESRACYGQAEIGYQIGILVSEKYGRFGLLVEIKFRLHRLPYGKLGRHIFAQNAYLRGNAFMRAAGKREERRGEKECKNKRLHCGIFRFSKHGVI